MSDEVKGEVDSCLPSQDLGGMSIAHSNAEGKQSIENNDDNVEDHDEAGDDQAGPQTWTITKAIENEGYPETNVVKTTKYSKWDFLPRSFALQFRRVGNIYFTVIVILMGIGSLSSVNLYSSPQPPWGNLFVLLLVFSLNMTSEGLDDKQRRRRDWQTNNQLAYIYSKEKSAFEQKTWGDVRRGDLISLEKNSICPADIALINASDTDSEACCYVQTANIDGETYLKRRLCKQEILSKFFGLETCAQWLMGRSFRYEPPSSSLSVFKVTIEPREGALDEQPISLNAENVVLRGAELRNTEWIWGVVLYTGKETKTLMAQGSTRIKQSKVDQLSNKVIVTVLVMLLILLVISILVLEFGYRLSTHQLWYMQFTGEADGYIFPAPLALLITYLILYRQILPILLYAVQEGMNVIQTLYIGWDLGMYDENLDKFASCNTTSLAQEIGQIKWIFSDKTGTLTRNEMRLVACSVGGKLYGRYTNKDLESLASVRDATSYELTRHCFKDLLNEFCKKPPGTESQEHFETDNSNNGTKNDGEEEQHETLEDEVQHQRQKELIQRFLKNISLCHTVLVESDGQGQRPMKDSTRLLRRSNLSSRRLTLDPEKEGMCTDSNLAEEEGEIQPKYNAESPDEEALVSAACAMGFQFAFTRGESHIGLCLKEVERLSLHNDILMDADESKLIEIPLKFRLKDFRIPKVEEWEVLAVNPFSSDRKRMSVVYRDPCNPDRLVLMCKGADNQMLAVANPGTTNFDQLKADLLTFSEAGLRTLLVGERELDHATFTAWAETHAKASALPPKLRKAKLDQVASEVEKNLTILGITAVEDRLQDGVPQTISVLRAAKINIWLITGDKVETAINISRSAELLTSSSVLIKLTASALGIGANDDDDDVMETEEEIQSRLLDIVQKHVAEQSAVLENLESHIEVEPSNRGCLSRVFDVCKQRVQSRKVPVNPNLALIVDGETVHYILSEKKKNVALETAFLHLSRMCNVVVACRASPGQKAQLVKLVKDNVYPTPTTLTIGDGANDVPMLEVGHVGVGIHGREGSQAVNCADFAIGQFKFLCPLLLVHGRYGYIRIAKSISIIFYGNLFFTFLSFFYSFLSRCSGQPIFSNLQYVVFQVFLALPTFAIGFFDRDRKQVYDVLKEPRTYDVGRLNKLLNVAMIDAQILRGAAHGIIAFILIFWQDYDVTFIAVSGALFVCATWVLTMRQATISACFTIPLVATLVFNIGAVVLLVFVLTILRAGSENIFVFNKAGRYYWNQLIATCLLVSLLDFIAPVSYAFLKRYGKIVKEKLPLNEESLIGIKRLTKLNKKATNRMDTEDQKNANEEVAADDEII